MICATCVHFILCIFKFRHRLLLDNSLHNSLHVMTILSMLFAWCRFFFGSGQTQHALELEPAHICFARLVPQLISNVYILIQWKWPNPRIYFETLLKYYRNLRIDADILELLQIRLERLVVAISFGYFQIMHPPSLWATCSNATASCGFLLRTFGPNTHCWGWLKEVHLDF